MNDLLRSATIAHGGLDRWDAYRDMEAEMSISGDLWSVKPCKEVLSDIKLEAATRLQHVILRQFADPDHFSFFEPNLVYFETKTREIVERREAPRTAFADHTLETPWDRLHIAYFCSYSLWMCLTAPFLYTYPGFVVKELSPTYENGEELRRLKVNFPCDIASHSCEQVCYFDQNGLLRRHDADIDVLGGVRVAIYAAAYREFGGIKVATIRRAFCCDEDGNIIDVPMLFSATTRSVEFS
ncbi:hypothetical protein SAMN05414139_10142 [Burkholderia sp. D7]|nr:hypothetical protein SAMN05414139_10142 [Burkholderia sp. D7]